MRTLARARSSWSRRPGCAIRRMRKLRDFAAAREFLSDREIDEMQVTIDERRRARAAGSG